jgi:hypothetical protein
VLSSLAIATTTFGFMSVDPSASGLLNWSQTLGKLLYETSIPSGISIVAMGRAGFPCTLVLGGADFVTTLLAVTIAPRPNAGTTFL